MATQTAVLAWDQDGERWLENGVKHGILFTADNTVSLGATPDDVTKSKHFYGNAAAWNGLTTATETPGGGDANDIWADDMKYAVLRSTETFGGTIESYTYPEEFTACDGSKESSTASGVYIGQQAREPFGFSFESQVFSDAASGEDEKLHLWYGCSASPSERSYQTINENVEGMSMSWEVTSKPIALSDEEKVALGVTKSNVSSITIQKSKTPSTTVSGVVTYPGYELLKKILKGYTPSGENATFRPGRLPYPSEIPIIVGSTRDTVDPVT